MYIAPPFWPLLETNLVLTNESFELFAEIAPPSVPLPFIKVISLRFNSELTTEKICTEFPPSMNVLSFVSAPVTLRTVPPETWMVLSTIKRPFHSTSNSPVHFIASENA